MSTDKAPDFAGIARKMATELYPITGTMSVDRQGDQNIRRDVFSLCAEARLRSDWETIRLLRKIGHVYECGAFWNELQDFPGQSAPTDPPAECTCGLSSHLSKLLEPFTP